MPDLSTEARHDIYWTFDLYDPIIEEFFDKRAYNAAKIGQFL